MRGVWFGIIVVAVMLALPSVAAQASERERERACIGGVFDAFCDPAIDSGLAKGFFGYADLMLFLILDLILALAVVALVFVVRRLRPTGMLKLGVDEKVKDVEPGGKVQFRFALENTSRSEPVDVFLERPELPSYWKSKTRVVRETETGFRMPTLLGEDGIVSLSATHKGINRANVDVVFKAPGDTNFEETLEYKIRALPMVDGKLRKRRAKQSKVTVLVSPEAPSVQILKVTHEPAKITPGLPVSTRVRVANKGDDAANGVRVAFLLNGDEVDAKSIDVVEGQGEAEVDFKWTAAQGENKIRLSVE